MARKAPPPARLVVPTRPRSPRAPRVPRAPGAAAPRPERRAERDIKKEVRLTLGQHPSERVLWLHVGGAIITRVTCPACALTFNAHDHSAAQVLDAGLGKGTPDTIGLLRGGRFFAAECKREGETETDQQKRRRRLINRLGGYACVVRSGADAEWHAQQAAAGAAAPTVEGDPQDDPPQRGASSAVDAWRLEYWRNLARANGLFRDPIPNDPAEARHKEESAGAYARAADYALGKLNALGVKP